MTDCFVHKSSRAKKLFHCRVEICAMRLTVHMLTGKTLIIEAESNTQVRQLKANLHKHTGESKIRFK